MNSLIQLSSIKAKQYCTIERVGIFGSADVDESHPVYQQALIVSEALARSGKSIVDGGGPGVMAAATIGAEKAGGTTIAVTFQPKDMPEFEGRFAGNVPDIEIKTSNYIDRMFGLIEESDAFVIFQGGTGTLSEWATVWLLAHLQYGHHRPLVLYGDFWPAFLKTVGDYFMVGDKERELYKIANSPEEVLHAIGKFEIELKQRCNLPTKEEFNAQ